MSMASVSLRVRAVDGIVGARRENRAPGVRFCRGFSGADREGKEAFKHVHALRWGKVLGFCGETSAVAPVVVVVVVGGACKL